MVDIKSQPSHSDEAVPALLLSPTAWKKFKWIRILVTINAKNQRYSGSTCSALGKDGFSNIKLKPWSFLTLGKVFYCLNLVTTMQLGQQISAV